MATQLILPGTNEFTAPADLVNAGGICRDCRDPKVVYCITVPTEGFPRGYYCYRCLAAHCRVTHRVPVPMGWDLMNALEVDLGIITVRMCP